MLLVDDDPDVREVLTAFLVRGGFGVIPSSDFKSAHARILSDPPEAMVVDVRLDGHNGLHLAWLLRSIRPEAAIVVATGFDDRLLREEAARADARFLVKPFAGRLLVEALKSPAHATLTP